MGERAATSEYHSSMGGGERRIMMMNLLYTRGWTANDGDEREREEVRERDTHARSSGLCPGHAINHHSVMYNTLHTAERGTATTREAEK